MPALSFSNGLCFLCPYNAFEKFTRETIRIQIFGSTEIHLGCIRKQEEENKPMISQTVLLNWWSKSHMATVIVYSTFFWDNVFSQWQQWGSSFPFLNKMLKKKSPTLTLILQNNTFGGLTQEKHRHKQPVMPWPPGKSLEAQERLTRRPHPGRFKPRNSSRTALTWSSLCFMHFHL